MSSFLLKGAASAVAPRGPRARLSILMYHRVLPGPDPLIDAADAKVFDTQIQALVRHFNVLPLSDAVARLRRGSLPARAASVTFDDGYRDNFDVALPILAKHGITATFFIATGFLDGGRMFNDTVIEAIRRCAGPSIELPALGLGPQTLSGTVARRQAVETILRHVKSLEPAVRQRTVDELASRCGGVLPNDLMMTRDQLRRLKRAGMDVGAHTVNHPILSSVSATNAVEEIRANREELEAIIDQPVELFAYPNGVPDQDYRAEHVEMVRALGFSAAVSTSWGVARTGADPFQLPRFTPWDRTQARFVMRILHNALARQPRVAKEHSLVEAA